MNKISAWGLNILLAGSIENTIIFEELFLKIKIQNDINGYLPDYLVDNIKTSIKFATRLSIKKDSVISGKLRRALVSLQDYGTRAGSKNVQQFLDSPESHSPLIITDLSAGDSELRIVNALLPFIGNGTNIISRPGALNDFNTIIRQTMQDFSA